VAISRNETVSSQARPAPPHNGSPCNQKGKVTPKGIPAETKLDETAGTTSSFKRAEGVSHAQEGEAERIAPKSQRLCQPKIGAAVLFQRRGTSCAADTRR